MSRPFGGPGGGAPGPERSSGYYSRPHDLDDFGSEAETVGGAEAQVIPLHGPGREKPDA